MDNLLEELTRWRDELKHQIDSYYAVDKVELKKLTHRHSMLEKVIEALSGKGSHENEA